MNPQHQNFLHLSTSNKSTPAMQALTVDRMKGFTLVELMISLVLGLLVSAAALQVFYTSSVNSRRQEASSQIQENAIFGFSQIQQHLRRSNYGAKSIGAYDEFFMNHLTPQGGLVLTAPSGMGTPVSWLQGNLSGLVLNGNAVPAALLSSNESGNSISNIDGIANSDQLTIQYRSDRAGTFDCEGAEIPEGFYVIERYFVRMDTTVSPNAPGLACASAIYDYNETTAGLPTGIDIKEYEIPAVPAVTTAPVKAAIPASTQANNLAGIGTIIIPNVDYFRAKLGISSSRDFATDPQNLVIAYIPIPTATNLTAALNARRIVSLQIGILARSDNPTATAQANSELTFTVLDKANVALNSAAISGPTYLRNVYETTVLLRNARGGL
ncbi:PilW family protein [Psychrobacter sp. NG27]|uniref:PilW family protein n=1 Tax=Psychrobacter sp. NG27 TaxID=2781966 RepID=UPI0018DF1A2F|nr:PilW family protein [Psychrobacter sp. NG27]MBI0426015.1 PilW family protein [Psychrobacter sp. NG27]